MLWLAISGTTIAADPGRALGVSQRPGLSSLRGVHRIGPFPIVSDREGVRHPDGVDGTSAIRAAVRRIIREETGLTTAVPALNARRSARVRPGTEGLQEKGWRSDGLQQNRHAAKRLRTLGQQVNADSCRTSEDKLPSSVSGCYGS